MEAREHERLAQHEEWYWWHRARERIVHGMLRRYAPPQARILDVGCGTGSTTASLRSFGSPLGLDIGAEALARARQRDLVVARSSAARLPVRREAFDVVVALDVLEHLEDDLGAAREIREALEPGGVLLVTVPAYQFLWSAHDVALGHRRRYRRRQLAELLAEAGFQVERCSYVMCSILPVALVVRLADRLRPARPDGGQSGYVPVPAFLNQLLTQIVGLGAHLVPWVNLPFGLSVIALARRPGRGAPDAGDTA